MTEVDFHFNAPDKVGYACRLLRKAVRTKGAKVVVVAEGGMLDEIDQGLWSITPTDFIAHCRLDADPAQVRRSSVILVGNLQDAGTLPHREVLVNLAAGLPLGFERFERLVDVVTTDDADRAAARQRWRHYADRGYSIRRHDFAEAVAR